MHCVKVPKSEGEKVRNKLLEKDLLEKNAKIDSRGDYIYIPIKRDDDTLDHPIVEREVEFREKERVDYREIVDVPEGLKDELPSSYEIIGDIAVLKVPDVLVQYEREIGRSLLEAHKNVGTVLKDKGVFGDLRIRDVEVIAGEDKTVTTYREYGTDFKIDLSSVYFSPRLSTERWRVVQKVKDSGKNEKVLDMFAGLGPYSVLLAKNTDVRKIYSIDMNPDAVALLKENLKRNKVEDRVEVFEGDASEVIDREDILVDRVIMNLPHSARDFIPSALKTIREGTVHYYEIMEEDRKEERIEEILSQIEEKGFSVGSSETHEVRTYSASKVHLAVDIDVAIRCYK